MAIIEKAKQNSSPVTGEDFRLNKIELEYLLLMIKESTFKGAELEQLYNLVYKLQQQYIKL